MDLIKPASIGPTRWALAISHSPLCTISPCRLPTYHLRPATYRSWNGHSLRTRERAIYAAVPTAKTAKAKSRERAAAVAST